MAQKRMLNPLKWAPVQGKGGGQHMTEVRQTQGNPRCPQRPPKLPNWGKHWRLPGKWCKNSKWICCIVQGKNWPRCPDWRLCSDGNCSAALQFHSIPTHFPSTLMLPRSWTSSIQPAAPEELCPHFWRQSEILLQFVGYLLDALRKFFPLILYLLQGQAHLLKHTCKGVGYSLFSLISNANQRKRIMTAFELLHKFGWFSFSTLIFSDFCTSEDCT